MPFPKMLFLDEDTGGGAGGTSPGQTGGATATTDAASSASQQQTPSKPQSATAAAGEAARAAEQAARQQQPTPAMQQTPQPTQTQTPTEQPAGSGGVLDYLRSRNLNPGNYANDESFILAAARAMQQLPQLQQHAQQWQQVAPQWEQFRQWQAQHGSQKQPAQPEQPKRWFPGMPQIDPSWAAAVEIDQTTGQFRFRDDAPTHLRLDPSIPQKVAEYYSKRQEWAHQFANDPIAALEPFKEEILKQMVPQIQQQLLAPMQVQQFAQSFRQQNASWMFEMQRDAQGRPVGYVNDPMTGGPQLTPAGQRMRMLMDSIGSYVQRLKGNNPLTLEDMQWVTGNALRQLQGEFFAYQMQRGQQQPQQPSQQQPAAPNADGRAARQPARNPNSPPPKGRDVRTLEERMNANLAAARNGVPSR